MIIRASSRLRKAYKKLPKSMKDAAEEMEKIFRVDPFNSRLNTHKLHGKYKDYWVFTISGQYRIMFGFAKPGIIDSINIGTHEIYK